jgi:hypothetical protein
LLAGADWAIDYLLAMLEPKPPCPTCGRSDLDRDPTVVRAAQIVLDRAGLGPSVTMHVERTPGEHRYLSPQELLARAEALADAMAEDLLRRESVTVESAPIADPAAQIPVPTLTTETPKCDVND